MPDGDVFTRSVARRWRNVASAVRDGLPVEECALRIENSLARELRASSGLARPDLEDLLKANPIDESQLAVRLGELVRREVFERVMPVLVAHGKYTSWEKAQQFTTFCLDTARLDLLARSLARHPDGNGVRRPKRSRSSTSLLLGEPAPLSGHA